MKESDFQNKFMKELEKKFPFMYARKIHGHEMQHSGMPDYICGINGKFVGIEFKVQRDGKIGTKPMQLRELRLIKDSNSISLIVAWDENKNRIFMRNRPLDYKKIFFDSLKSSAKTKQISIDWDWDFSKYEDAVELIGVMVA
jgi:Holliday junction resolvase